MCATAWPPCACVPQVFEQLINTTLCLAFLRKFVCRPLCCVPLQMHSFYQILSSSLNTMLIVDKHSSGVCCGEFPMSQIDRKSKTRHGASTSMYSLTFCVRVVSPARHHWKPAVQATAVMLRTPPPVDGQSPASQPRPLPIYGAQF